MRLSELAAREDLDAILRRTLAAAWEDAAGEPAQVVGLSPGAAPPPGAQRWVVQPTLGAYFPASVAGLAGGVALARAARHWLRDTLRFSPVLHRVPAQWALVEALASPWGLRVTSRPAFAVTPARPLPAHQLVVPGNQRVRLFDFARGVCRVVVKDGFDDATLAHEAAARRAATAGGLRTSVVPVLATGRTTSGHGPTGGALAEGLALPKGLAWLDEPIVQGVSLPRLPPWVDPAPFRAAALDAIARHHAATVGARAAGEAADQAAATVAERRGRVSERFGDPLDDVARAADALGRAAAGGGEVPFAAGHGDFQPGNVLCRATSTSAPMFLSGLGGGHPQAEPPGGVILLDWEHAGVRSRAYDALTWHLNARSPAGLAQRVEAYLGGDPAPREARPCAEPERPTAGDCWREARRAWLALFLLEDLAFALGESLTGPYRAPGRSLSGLRALLAHPGPRLRALLEDRP